MRRERGLRLRQRRAQTPLRVWLARAGGLVGLSAASAIAAHAGPAGFAEPGLLAVTLTGALLAAAVLVTGAIAAVGARRLAAALTVRDLQDSAPTPRISAVPAPVVVAAMLTCQGAAHVALLLAGVPMAGSQTGTLAVHVAAGLIASALWLAVDRLVGCCYGKLEAAIVALLATLRSRTVLLSPRATVLAVGVRLGVYGLPRGPPAQTL
jgi:hypothetical protein